MLRLSRDSSIKNHIWLKGINLSFRDCPYVLLLNLLDFETRLDGQLSSKDTESFRNMINHIAPDLLGSVMYLEQFFGSDILMKKAPICMRACDVMRDMQGGGAADHTVQKK